MFKCSEYDNYKYSDFRYIAIHYKRITYSISNIAQVQVPISQGKDGP